MTFPTVVAIDGPVASGKTAVSRLLSRKLGYRCLDTGNMYRAITWMAIAKDVEFQDQEGLSRLAIETSIEISWRDPQQVTANGADITTMLRIPQVEEAVSLVAQVHGVRKALVQQQREIASQGMVVVVGRDIGTVVLPKAPLKVFLNASVHERALRRHLEIQMRGGKTTFEKVLLDLQNRDTLDTHRAISPLRPAHDAHVIDTDSIGIEEVADKILNLTKGNNDRHI